MPLCGEVRPRLSLGMRRRCAVVGSVRYKTSGAVGRPFVDVYFAEGADGMDGLRAEFEGADKHLSSSGEGESFFSLYLSILEERAIYPTLLFRSLSANRVIVPVGV